MTWNRIYNSDVPLDRQQLYCWSYTYKVGHVVGFHSGEKCPLDTLLGTLFACAHLGIGRHFQMPNSA